MGDHTFVCYAREDEEYVLSLYSNLRVRGARVWIDKRDIASGADWDRSIDQAIKDCAHFLIVLSPDSETSREVRGELRMALNKEKPIVPLLYKTCEIPRQLLTIQHITCGQRSADNPTLLDEVVQALGMPRAISGIFRAARKVAPTPD